MDDTQVAKIAQLNDRITRLRREVSEIEHSHEMLQSFLLRKYPTILDVWESGMLPMSINEIATLPLFSKVSVEWGDGGVSSNVVIFNYNSILYCIRSQESELGCRIGEVSNSDKVFVANDNAIDGAKKENIVLRKEVARLKKLINIFYQKYKIAR